MDAIRRARLASVIQEELSVFVPSEVKDPRIPSLIFTQVEVTEDAKQAKVFFTISGHRDDETVAKEQAHELQECIEGLESSSGYMRRHLAKILNIRHVPALLFREDKGYQNTQRVNELLRIIGTNDPAKPSSTDG